MMNKTEKTILTVQTTVNAPVATVWKSWTSPENIVKWNHASVDWHTTRAENDLREGGRFVYRMEAKDGSFGFDFSGVYKKVIPLQQIEYTLDDDRIVKIVFKAQDNQVKIIESFEAETTNPPEMQRNGWQAILDNFKKHTEEFLHSES